MTSGERLAAAWHEEYEVDLGEHVYPTEKYRLVRERLSEVGLLSGEIRLLSPEPAPEADLARVHTEAYLEKVRTGRLTRQEELRLEVPFSRQLRRAMLLACGGTTLASRRALDQGVAVHLGGGFHHAFPDHGEGFCLFNDVAVALRALQAEGRIATAAVVDCDVHQGNGTAEIFSDDPAVFTLSLHQDRLYPAARPPSDLDVALPDRVGDERYLERLDAALPRALEEPEPDLALYLAGADPYRGDQLGGLGLTLEGLRRRDRRVLGALAERGIPGVVVLAGGYATRVRETVSIHAATVEEALAALRGPASGGAGHGSGRPAAADDEPASGGESPRAG